MFRCRVVLIRIPAQQNSIRRPWRIAPLLAMLGKLKGDLKSKATELVGYAFVFFIFSFTLLNCSPTEQAEERVIYVELSARMSERITLCIS